LTLSIDSVEQIGKLIQTERKRQGIRQQDLADLSGVSWHFLSNLENGKTTVESQKILLVLRSLGIKIEMKTRSPAGGVT
jgi:y4mF family transcriptional regulator